MGDISKDAGNEIPRRYAFSEVAHARHYSSILDTALAYSQHCLCRNDKLRSVRVYFELTLITLNLLSLAYSLLLTLDYSLLFFLYFYISYEEIQYHVTKISKIL